MVTAKCPAMIVRLGSSSENCWTWTSSTSVRVRPRTLAWARIQTRSLLLASQWAALATVLS